MTETSVVIPEPAVPIALRLIGARFRDGRRSFRMKWGELSAGRWGFALALCLFEEGFSFHVHFLLLNVFVKLPFLRRFAWDPAEIMESWGLQLVDGTIHLNCGPTTNVIPLPWSRWVHVSHSVRRPDGSYVPYVGSWEEAREGRDGKEPDGRAIEVHLYHYMLQSGEVQHRTATVHVGRREWRLKGLQWCPWLAKVRHSIDVQFSDEVGERSGSWKGGTMGCGYDLRPNETPRECLRRMQRDRKF